MIQPAFRNDVDAGEAEADQYPQCPPGIGIDNGRIEDEGCGYQRTQSGKNTHMPDALQQDRGQLGATQKADEIAGHDESHGAGVNLLKRAAHTQQRALQPVTQHQQKNAEHQSPGLFEYEQHEVQCVRLGVHCTVPECTGADGNSGITLFDVVVATPQWLYCPKQPRWHLEGLVHRPCHCT